MIISFEFVNHLNFFRLGNRELYAWFLMLNNKQFIPFFIVFFHLDSTTLWWIFVFWLTIDVLLARALDGMLLPKLFSQTACEFVRLENRQCFCKIRNNSFLMIFSNMQNGRLEAGEGGPRRGANQKLQINPYAKLDNESLYWIMKRRQKIIKVQLYDWTKLIRQTCKFKYKVINVLFRIN